MPKLVFSLAKREASIKEQIIGFLKETNSGVPVKSLEMENARLKKLLAE